MGDGSIRDMFRDFILGYFIAFLTHVLDAAKALRIGVLRLLTDSKRKAGKKCRLPDMLFDQDLAVLHITRFGGSNYVGCFGLTNYWFLIMPSPLQFYQISYDAIR